MIHKIAVVILTLLIAVSAFSAYGTVPGDCTDQSCCCQGTVMAGHMGASQTDGSLKIQAMKRCCCEEADGSACNLSARVPLEKIGWALSTSRLDPSAPLLPVMTPLADKDNDLHIASPTVIAANAPHPGSPPIYLAAMSFLC